MRPTLDEMRSLVAAELTRSEVRHARDQLAALLVEPEPIRLDWQYDDESGPFDAWRVARSADGRIDLVHCREGLGSDADPWGAVFVEEGHMGMDAQWHSGLLDAAICVGLIAPPAGYEVP